MELEFMTCRASKLQMYTDSDVDQVDTIVMLNDSCFMTDSWKKSWKGIIPETTIRSFDEQIRWVWQKEHCQDYWESVRRYKYDVLYQCFDHEWKKYKQIYELDADFAKELLQTNKGEIKIYLEEIGTLPFHCFAIDVSKLSLNITEDENNPNTYIKSITVLPVLYKRDIADEDWVTISIEILIDYNNSGFVTDRIVLPSDDLVESEDGNANKLSIKSCKSKAPNSQPKRKRCFIFFLLHILQCLVHFIHILSDSLLCRSNLAHTVSLAERFKFFVQSLVHTDIQIFDFFFVVIFHICYLTVQIYRYYTSDKASDSYLRQFYRPVTKE